MSLLTFPEDEGRDRKPLALLILHSIEQEPKSGYDLLKEFADKTENTWIPSKGTVYPILKQLEEEKLIEVYKTEKRSKKVFRPTEEGRRLLIAHKRNRQEMHKKMRVFRKMFMELFGEDSNELRDLLFDIRESIETLPSDRENEAAIILSRCREDLKRIE